jgi:hypothetical protein
VPEERGVPSSISSRPDLLQQSLSDVAPLLPALKQVIMEGIDERFSRWWSPVLGFATGSQPSLNRTSFHADHRRDAARSDAVLAQPQDFGESFATGFAAISPEAWRAPEACSSVQQDLCSRRLPDLRR